MPNYNQFRDSLYVNNVNVTLPIAHTVRETLLKRLFLRSERMRVKLSCSKVSRELLTRLDSENKMDQTAKNTEPHNTNTFQQNYLTRLILFTRAR